MLFLSPNVHFQKGATCVTLGRCDLQKVGISIDWLIDWFNQ